MRNIFKPKKKLSIMEEEQIFSPWRTVFQNFITRRLSVISVFVFIAIFLCCMILPIFFPLDVTFNDATQQNIRPALNFMRVPAELKNNAKAISVGSSYGIGLDKAGKLYQWGVLTDKLKKIPEDMGEIVHVSAGLDHAIAYSAEGKVYTWGNDRLGLNNIPMDINGANIIQMEAGHQISTALDDKGRLYVWGNENIISISPRDAQGRIKSYALNTTTVIALLEDGTVACLTNKEVPFSYIPDSVQGHTVQVESTDRAAAALLDGGTVVVWGSLDYGEDKIPEHAQGHIVSLSAGRNHFSAILDDGNVVSWGRNDKGQIASPKLDGVQTLSVGYYQNYTIDSGGNVSGWGFKGYLMGSDQYGRDVFLRLIYAGRMTMTIGAISIIISTLIGVLIGGISGYYGGKVDMFLMRITEVVASIPFLPLALILSAIIGSKIPETWRIAMIMCIIGLLGWTGLARLTRAQFLAERENEYVTAAKAMGIREFVIIFRHILPNVMPIILVSVTLGLASCMITEATLSFLGFGVREPSPTWGNMLYSCVDSTVIANFWWRWVFPAIALSLSVLSINTVGDGFRDAVDPKSNDR